MKYYFFIFFIFWHFEKASAQKPVIDTSAFGHFPSLKNVTISDDGKYSMFIESYFPSSNKSILEIREKNGNKVKQFSNESFRQLQFSSNSKSAFFLFDDTLVICTLNTGKVEFIPNVTNFKQFDYGTKVYVGYLTKSKPQNLVILGQTGKDLLQILNVRGFHFSNTGDLIITEPTSDGELIKIVNLISKQSTIIWKGHKIIQLLPDHNAINYCFTAIDSDKRKALYYINIATNSSKPQLIINDSSPLLAGKSSEISDLSFTQEGDKILFSVASGSNKPQTNNNKQYANVDIWNYKDEYNQSLQISPYFELNVSSKYFFICDLHNKRFISIAHPGQTVYNSDDPGKFILKYDHENSSRGFYEKEFANNYYLVNEDNGTECRIIKGQNLEMSDIKGFSPDQRFFLWFDPDSLAYFSYDVASGIKRNLSRSIPTPLYDEAATAVGRFHASYGIAGWSGDGNWVYIYDKFDLWKTKLNGNGTAINITNGFGRKNHITFAVVNPFTPEYASPVKTIIDSKQRLTLSGYNDQTKINGLWTTVEGQFGDPRLKLAGPYCFYIGRTGKIGNIEYAKGTVFIKAKHSPTYLFQRMAADEFPNLYVTDNFKTYHQLSDLHPEQLYNWITSELVSWKMPNGQMSHGILYKPENFDPSKKYPVIFNYYEKWSDRLHQYILPNWTGDLMNVPYFVSNGYLMFYPDIYYQPGENGQGVLNSVVSAAKYLSSFPYVDAEKLGIQGHSFAGWETNFLVTHTKLFAAACEGAGVSDLISAYDELNKTGFDRQAFYEFLSQGSPFGLGKTPWTDSIQYIHNSPVFYVENATTPLLMMQGDNDYAVPFSQSIEMYLAMKRARKKVWLLQYEGANHGLDNIDAKDYTIRMKQFFDYYLKGCKPPIWMTRGRPALLKGKDNAYQYDETGATP